MYQTCLLLSLNTIKNLEISILCLKEEWVLVEDLSMKLNVLYNCDNDEECNQIKGPYRHHPQNVEQRLAQYR